MREVEREVERECACEREGERGRDSPQPRSSHEGAQEVQVVVREQVGALGGVDDQPPHPEEGRLLGHHPHRTGRSRNPLKQNVEVAQ
eukprot:3880191-Prymnesium_polylepis.1